MTNLPATFQERVTTKINEVIADLIPQESVSALVDAQIKKFMSDDFPGMVKKEIFDAAKELIKAELEKPEFREGWMNQITPSELVHRVLVEAAPEMFATIMSQAAAYTVQNLRNNRGW